MTTADYLNQLEQDRQDLVDNLETKGITGLSGDETFTELVPMVLNIQSGANLDDYFTKQITNSTGSSNLYRQIKRIPSDTVPYAPNNSLAHAFYNCINLIEVPLMDTSQVNWMPQMFYNCSSLQTVPVFNTSIMLNMEDMFFGCPNLTEQSLDNILQMCINATATYQSSRTKSLYALGLRGTDYSSQTIQNLLHYQDFIDSGWTIGW